MTHASVHLYLSICYYAFFVGALIVHLFGLVVGCLPADRRPKPSETRGNPAGALLVVFLPGIYALEYLGLKAIGAPAPLIWSYLVLSALAWVLGFTRLNEKRPLTNFLVPLRSLPVLLVLLYVMHLGLLNA